MKFKIICITACLFFISSAVFAQNVNGIPISELNVQYINLFDVTCNFAGDVHVKIDYGQKLKGHKKQFVRDIDGNYFNFNSFTHALNVMFDNGYQLKEIVNTGDEADDVYYILEHRN